MTYRLTLTALLIGASFYLGMACQPPRIVQHEVLVTIERPTYLPLPKSAMVKHSVDVLAAAIPLSALQWKGK